MTALAGFLSAGCGEDDAAVISRDGASTAPSTQSSIIKVASLVPAATDLMIGMGAGEHLVAISNYDIDREATRDLPKVGDYQTVDWERLQSLRPQYLIIFQRPDRVPAGMRQQADAMGVHFINVQTETLEDLYGAMHRLGDIIQKPELARAAEQKLRGELDAVRASVQGKPRIPTLIVRDEKATAVVGRGTFINELLEIAGGENVIDTIGWPDIDRERLMSLKPQAIIQLLSAAPPQVERQAMRVWDDLNEIPAVRDKHVHLINEWYTQQPGYHVAELARQMAAALHGS